MYYHQWVVSAFPSSLSEDLSKDSRWKLSLTEIVPEPSRKNWTEHSSPLLFQDHWVQALELNSMVLSQP